MAEQFEHQQDDEINLAELFALVWSHKILIGFITGICIFSRILCVDGRQNIHGQYGFEIKKNDANGFNIPGDLGALASLAGVGGATSSGSALCSKINKARIYLASRRQAVLRKGSFSDI